MQKFFNIGLVLAIIVIAIEGNYHPTAAQKTIAERILLEAPISYGNGVYYFNTADGAFGVSLADFIGKSSNRLELVSMVAKGTYAGDRGYFVVFREKK